MFPLSVNQNLQCTADIAADRLEGFSNALGHDSTHGVRVGKGSSFTPCYHRIPSPFGRFRASPSRPPVFFALQRPSARCGNGNARAVRHCLTFASPSIYPQGTFSPASAKCYCIRIGGLRNFGASKNDRQKVNFMRAGMCRSWRLRETRSFFEVGIYNGECAGGALTQITLSAMTQTGPAHAHLGPFCCAPSSDWKDH